MKTTSRLYQCLLALSRDPDTGMTNAELSKISEIGAPNPSQASVVTSILAKKKLVSRKPDPNSRGYIFTINAAGREVVSGGGLQKRTDEAAAQTSSRREEGRSQVKADAAAAAETKERQARATRRRGGAGVDDEQRSLLPRQRQQSPHRSAGLQGRALAGRRRAAGGLRSRVLRAGS